MASLSNLQTFSSEILWPECQEANTSRQLAERLQSESLDGLLNALDEPNYPKHIKDFINCSVILKAEATPDPIGYEKSQKIVDAYLKLCQARRLNESNYISHLNSILSRELLACDDLNTVFLFGKIALNLKNFVSDLSMIECSLDISYSPCIFELALGTDKEKIIEALKALIKGKDLKLDSTGAEHAIFENALSWVENNEDFYKVKAGQNQVVNPDREGTQIINGLMVLITPSEQEFIERHKILTSMYGLIEVCDLYKETYSYDDQNELQLSSVPLGTEISSINQITVNENPLRTSFTDNKRIYTYIYKGKIKATGAEICIKKIRAEEDVRDLQKFDQEVKIMRELSGKNEAFLKFYGSFIIDRDLYILMEYVEDNLMDVLKRNKLTELQQISIARKLIEGFAFLSQKKIYHRDIKPHNILITPQLDPKIIDFGITIFDMNPNLSDSTHTSLVSNSRFIQGTQGYMSPEQKIAFDEFRNSRRIIRYGLLLSDVFSLGITLFQMATGTDVSRYEDEKNNDELKQKVNELKSNELRKVIISMIDKKPSSRRNFIEVLQLVGGKTITVIN